MAILVSDNFNYKARKPLDNRIMQPTVADMKKLKDATLYDGMLCYVQDENKFYVYDTNNTIDSITGKFRELQLNGDSLAKAYAQNEIYVKDSLVFHNDQLARVVANYTSDSTEVDAEASFRKDVDDKKLVLFTGEVEQNIKPYSKNTQYYRNDLVFIGSSLARVLIDFVSDNSAATDEDAFKVDLANKNLALISGGSEEFLVYEVNKKLEREVNRTTTLKFADFVMTPGSTITDLVLESLVYDVSGTVGKITHIDETADEIIITTMSISESNQYMKQAPDKRTYKITNNGSGYVVGDIIETSEPGRFVEITSVGVNGEIVSIIDTISTAANTNGVDATITAERILYTGSGNNWIQLPTDVDTHSYEYTIGIDYKKGNLVTKDNKLYLVSKDFTAANFDTEFTNKNLVRIGNDTTGIVKEYKVGEELTKDSLIIKDNKLYIASKDFTAADFDTELNDGSLIKISGEGGTVLQKYQNNTAYTKDSLVYLDNKIARVVVDYTSSNEATEKDSWNQDCTTNNLVEIGGSGDALITKNITSTINVGNINANQTIAKDTSLTEFVEKLLVKEITPTGNIIVSGRPSNGLEYKGNIVNVTGITANITGKGTVTITNIKFYKGNTVLDTQAFTDGTNSYTYSLTDAVATDTSYSIGIEYNKKDGTTSEAKYSASIEFVNYAYYGSHDKKIILTDSIIKAMSKTNIKKIKGFTETFNPNDQIVVYAYPANLGDLTSIKDQNNFEYLTNSYGKVAMTINGETYNVYTMNDPVTATGLKQVFV